jgi:periplasmic divalent cation tolerance protein
VKSIYWWEGQVQESAELMLMLKTDKKNVYKLEELILEEHPYSTPEFVVLDSSFVTPKYKKWLEESLE